ncbi:MAG: hypothetical protein QNJ62_05015 [Methyloceanibacter sp.]|nr:hypothetical protein [Methyloceanibacter sp.]
MPFDGIPKRTAEQQANLIELIHDLRNLPEWWDWDYDDPCGCAMGWLGHRRGIHGWADRRNYLGLDADQQVDAFYAEDVPLPVPHAPTPHDVADILEGYL